MTRTGTTLLLFRASRKTIKSVCSNQGRDMKFVTGLLAAVVLLAGVGASHAVVRIADDRGGRIGTYVNKYYGLRSSGESVVIDGLCASACTIVLSAVPHDKICVTSRATLGFHAAWDFGANGRTITDREATMTLYSMYPMRVRRWIAARRVDASHDLPTRQGAAGDVQALLSRPTSLFPPPPIGPSRIPPHPLPPCPP